MSARWRLNALGQLVLRRRRDRPARRLGRRGVVAGTDSYDVPSGSRRLAQPAVRARATRPAAAGRARSAAVATRSWPSPRRLVREAAAIIGRRPAAVAPRPTTAPLVVRLVIFLSVFGFEPVRPLPARGESRGRGRRGSCRCQCPPERGDDHPRASRARRRGPSSAGRRGPRHRSRRPRGRAGPRRRESSVRPRLEG